MPTECQTVWMQIRSNAYNILSVRIWSGSKCLQRLGNVFSEFIYKTPDLTILTQHLKCLTAKENNPQL